MPYDEFHRFHEAVAEDSVQRVVADLEGHILPLVPNLLEDLTLGIDVLQVGCGRGYVLNKMAFLFPHSQFTGYDLSEDAIATAITQSQQLHNIHFQIRDTTHLEEIEKYDLITTFDAIHAQVRPDWVLRNIYNALRPDGVYLMQETHAASDVSDNLNHPLAPLLYTVSCMRCMTISLAANDLKSGTLWGREKALELLQDAGFTQIKIEQLPHDVINDYYIVCK